MNNELNKNNKYIIQSTTDENFVDINCNSKKEDTLERKKEKLERKIKRKEEKKL